MPKFWKMTNTSHGGLRGLCTSLLPVQNSENCNMTDGEQFCSMKSRNQGTFSERNRTNRTGTCHNIHKCVDCVEFLHFHAVAFEWFYNSFFLLITPGAKGIDFSVWSLTMPGRVIRTLLKTTCAKIHESSFVN